MRILPKRELNKEEARKQHQTVFSAGGWSPQVQKLANDMKSDVVITKGTLDASNTDRDDVAAEGAEGLPNKRKKILHNLPFRTSKNLCCL